jgi:TetR/AcrR family transcriptional regulator, transcriptional repressor for nem operon
MKPKVGRPPGDVRNNVLQAMIRLVVRQGFSGTTVAQICEEAGVTKGGFFHHFTTKEDAALAALEMFYRERSDAQLEFVNAQASSAQQRVVRQIDFALTPAATKFQGCFLGVMALETSRTHPVLQSCCQKLFAQWIQEFSDELHIAAPHLSTHQTHSAARAFVATIEGGLMISKCSADPTQVRDALGHFKTQLQSLMTHQGAL